MKQMLNKLLGCLNIKVTRKSTFDRLVASSVLNGELAQDLAMLSAIRPEFVTQFVAHLDRSRSQIRQDLFVLSELGFKRDGFFVEFGATNGVDLSNSYLLETRFGWHGILAEPARVWHKELKANRKAHIETDCVWRETGQSIVFNQSRTAELSTIDRYSGSDFYDHHRGDGSRYAVNTISLGDMLDKYNSPRIIDYLSIDTEGSEFDILNNFDFHKYKFRVITCEHNYNNNRDKIHNLLTKNGYRRKMKEYSLFDDWYILHEQADV